MTIKTSVIDALTDYNQQGKDFVVLKSDKLDFLVGGTGKNVSEFSKYLQGFSRQALNFEVLIQYINPKDDPEYYI